MDTHEICDFGKWRGECYASIPVSYLKWMINIGHNKAGLARDELDRRGTVTPECEISAHAINRASQRCLDAWQKTRIGDEGLHTWLCRTTMEALSSGTIVEIRGDDARYSYEQLEMIINTGGVWPVLKTIMLDADDRYYDANDTAALAAVLGYDGDYIW